MSVLKNVLSQWYRYLLWALMSGFFWGWIFGFVTNTDAAHKVVLYANVDEMQDKALALRLEEKFSRTYAQEDKPPWVRYSASVGMADSESSDLALDPVLKRADKAMYAAKQAFKAKHGGYR